MRVTADTITDIALLLLPGEWLVPEPVFSAQLDLMIMYAATAQHRIATSKGATLLSKLAT
jgi:hypothetical protein